MSKNRFSVLRMSWWFTSRLSLPALVDFLEAEIPEALPVRYGLFEPPPIVYEKEGKAAFVDFLMANAAGTVICNPRRPAVSFDIRLYDRVGFVRNGARRRFRCHHLSLGFEAAALATFAEQAPLRKVWMEISGIVRPFFGDVRHLDGFFWNGSMLFTDRQTKGHPVAGGWWRGLPDPPGQAVVLGPPYAGLWPRATECGETRGGLVFVSTPLWQNGKDVTGVTGPVPAGLTQPARTGPFSMTAEEISKRMRFLKFLRESSPSSPAGQDNEQYADIFPFAAGGDGISFEERT